MKKSGFSLIEVLIASALLGGLALTTTKLSSQKNKLNSFYDQELEAIFMLNDIRSFLTSEAVCTKNFGGMDPHDSNIVNEILDTKGNKRYEVGSLYGNNKVSLNKVNFSNSQLSLFAKSDATQGFVKLYLDIEKKSLNPIQGKNLNKEILLNVTLDAPLDANGKIKTCSAISSQKLMTSSLWNTSSSVPNSIYYPDGVVIGEKKDTETLKELEVHGDVNIRTGNINKDILQSDKFNNLKNFTSKDDSSIKNNVYFTLNPYGKFNPGLSENVMFGEAISATDFQGYCSVTNSAKRNVILGTKTFLNNHGDDNVCLGSFICNKLSSNEWCSKSFSRNIVIGNAIGAASTSSNDSIFIGSSIASFSKAKDSIFIGADNFSSSDRLPGFGSEYAGGIPHESYQNIVLGSVYQRYLTGASVKIEDTLILHPKAYRPGWLFTPYKKITGATREYGNFFNIANLISGTFDVKENPNHSGQIIIGRPYNRQESTTFLWPVVKTKSQDIPGSSLSAAPGKFINQDLINQGKVRLLVYGVMLATNNFFKASDARLKDDITPLPSTLHSILKLEGKKYIQKIEGKDRESSGLIADEVEKVLPQLVNTQGPYLSLKYGELVPHLVKALQEIRDLKHKLKEDIKLHLNEHDNE